MYYYIYDSFLEENKEYAKLLSKIETQVNNIGLTGERTRITSIKKIDQLVLEAADKGYDPIIIVGRDHTFSAAASALAKADKKTRLAFVPTEKNSIIAGLLGVNQENAIITLSRRLVKRVPLACANGHYFLANVLCNVTPEEKRGWWQRFVKKVVSTPFEPELVLDETFSIKAKATDVVIHPGFSINRLKIKLNLQHQKSKTQKSFMEKSIFWPNKVRINCKEPVPVTIDGRKISRTPLEVKLTSNAVNLIVGPQRRFP